jgi:hypothetical protein
VDAFYLEHRRRGELDSGGDGVTIWLVYSRGAALAATSPSPIVAASSPTHASSLSTAAATPHPMALRIAPRIRGPGTSLCRGVVSINVPVYQGGVNPRSHIFISYARSDGEEFARRIHERLESDENLTCWGDRLDLEGGEGF